MRVLKILLIIFSLLIVFGVSYAIWEEFLQGGIDRVPSVGYIYIASSIVLSAINSMYHLKSFRFYRRKEKRNLDKKISKFLWVGGLCFSVYLLSLVGVAVYNNAERYLHNTYNAQDVFFLSLLLVIALLGFLEISLLKKRIKRLKTERDTKDEINDIGNLTT